VTGNVEDPLYRRWWEDTNLVAHRFAGVFEGGGAKGVAYLGALEATLEARCWFGAVAGASAGAITAALIASGLRPQEIGSESIAAFERLGRTSIGTGLKQLRLKFGFLDNEGLRDWLDEKLARQARSFGVEVPGPVTFATLYAATEIELNVVAADVSRGRQIVFSVWDTPGAQVADAVLASSSIPFVFAPRYLRVPDGENAYVHTLVDGGAWSNFPAFVFRDRSFRAAFGRPEHLSEDYVVGYLLDEPREGDPDFKESSFVGLGDAADPKEWHVVSGKERAKRSGLARGRALAVIAWSPVWLLLRFGAWLSLGNSRAWKGRWPQSPGGAGRALRAVDDTLSALHSAWLAGVAALAVVAGSILSIYWLVTSFLLLRFDEIRFDVAFHEWGSTLSETVQVILVTVAVGLIVSVMGLTLGALTLNYFALGPVRQMLYGIVRTYATGPGAPAWAGAADDDFVLRLPIPKELTTLSFDRTEPKVAAAILKTSEDARRATTSGLRRILSRPTVSGPGRPSVEALAAPEVSSVAPSAGGGPALPLRLTVVALGITGLVFLAAMLLPEPAWHQYEVNVRMCSEPLVDPSAPCAVPTQRSAYATVLFGPASAGRMTQAEVTVNGHIVERSTSIRSTQAGRILGYEIDWETLCGLGDCVVTVRALVDGRSVFSAQVERRIDLDVRRG
jgi:predicted acylesterase/phospholipase RssA